MSGHLCGMSLLYRGHHITRENKKEKVLQICKSYNYVLSEAGIWAIPAMTSSKSKWEFLNWAA